MTDFLDNKFPEDFSATVAEIVEFNTLCAVYEHESSGAMIRIVPIPTDRVAPYTHSHRVILETPEDGQEVIAEGPEVDNLRDANLAAVEEMKEN